MKTFISESGERLALFNNDEFQPIPQSEQPSKNEAFKLAGEVGGGVLSFRFGNDGQRKATYRDFSTALSSTSDTGEGEISVEFDGQNSTVFVNDINFGESTFVVDGFVELV